MFNISMLVSLGSTVLALLLVLLLLFNIKSKPDGSKKMIDAAKETRKEGMTLLRKNYSSVSIVGSILFVILLYLFSWNIALGFLAGLIVSVLSGYLGEKVSAISNLRIAEAAKTGSGDAFGLAIKSGLATNLFATSIALISVAGIYFITKDFTILLTLAFGLAVAPGVIPARSASSGQAPAGIQDSKRSSSYTTATFAIAIIAAMALSRMVFPKFDNASLFPLFIGGASIVILILASSLILLLRKSSKIIRTLNIGIGLVATLSLVASFFLINWLLKDNGQYSFVKLFFSSAIGVVILCLTWFTSRIFPSYQGAIKAVRIAAGLLAAFALAGYFGVTLLVVGMLPLLGLMAVIEIFYNAGAVAHDIAVAGEMDLEAQTRLSTLEEDGSVLEVAILQNMSVLATFTSVVLFLLYAEKIGVSKPVVFNLADPYILSGLIFGGVVMYFVSILVSNWTKEKSQINVKNLVFPVSTCLVAASAVGFLLGSASLGAFIIGAILSGLFTTTNLLAGSLNKTIVLASVLILPVVIAVNLNLQSKIILFAVLILLAIALKLSDRQFTKKS